MRRLLPITLAAALGAAGLLAAGPATAGDGDRIRYRCVADGAGDISMSATLEIRAARKRLSIEFEAATPGAFRAGRTVAFAVGGEPVIARRLAAVPGGDVQAEVTFDTRVREAFEDSRPFPRRFPRLGKGTTVSVIKGKATVLSCKLG
jgi:hypothetical protein